MNDTNNKLIAEFMGIDINATSESKDSAYMFAFEHDNGFNDEYYDDTLEFHKSWDWLMPVVAKIVPPHGWVGKLVKPQSNVMLMVQYANMGNTYEAVVDFITEYNIHEKPHRHIWRKNEKRKV